MTITTPREEIPDFLISVAASMRLRGDNYSASVVDDAATHLRELAAEVARLKGGLQDLTILAGNSCTELRSELHIACSKRDALAERCAALTKERDEARTANVERESDPLAEIKPISRNDPLVHGLEQDIRSARFAARLASDENQRLIDTCAALTKERDEARQLAEAHGKKRSELTQLLDAQLGTPCEQIRHEQEVEELKREISSLRAQLAPEEFEERTRWVVIVNDGDPMRFDSWDEVRKFHDGMLPCATTITIRPETIRAPVEMVAMEVWLNVYPDNWVNRCIGHHTEEEANAHADDDRRFGRALKRTIWVPSTGDSK